VVHYSQFMAVAYGANAKEAGLDGNIVRAIGWWRSSPRNWFIYSVNKKSRASGLFYYLPTVRCCDTVRHVCWHIIEFAHVEQTDPV